MGKIYYKLFFIFCLTGLILSNTANVLAQTEISVPLPEGWIGAVGANTQQANAVKSFATMGIKRVFLTQISTSGQFEIQGNDVSVVLKIELLSGIVLQIPGSLTWRVASGNDILAFGIIPAAGSSVSYTYNSVNYSIYGLVGTNKGSNIVLKKVEADLSYADGSSISGNAAKVSSMLAELNTYLSEVNLSKPQGPVTVSSATAFLSSANIVVTGTASLTTGESLSVILNGTTYSVSSALTLSGTTWTLTVTNTGFSAGSYNVSAIITNSSGYTLVDNTLNELTIYTNPSITTQPVSITAATGSTVTLTVSVAGGSGSYTYQWQRSSTSDGTYSNVASGGTSSSYTPQTGTAGTMYYRVLVSDAVSGSAQVTSNVVHVTFSDSFSFSSQPQSVTVCLGTINSTTTLSCSVSNVTGTVSYQWQSSTTSGGTYSNVASGGTSSTYDAPIASAGTTYYRVIATDSNGASSITSNAAAVTVNQPSFTPSNTLADIVLTKMTGATIQWYSTDGTALAATTTLVNGTTYYASETVNGVESLSRLAVTVTVDSTPCAQTGTAAQSFSSGATVASLSATGSNIRWYDSASGETALAATTTLVNGYTYYATQTVDCTESAGRLAVAVTVTTQ